MSAYSQRKVPETNESAKISKWAKRSIRKNARQTDPGIWQVIFKYRLQNNRTHYCRTTGGEKLSSSLMMRGLSICSVLVIGTKRSPKSSRNGFWITGHINLNLYHQNFRQVELHSWIPFECWHRPHGSRRENIYMYAYIYRADFGG